MTSKLSLLICFQFVWLIGWSQLSTTTALTLEEAIALAQEQSPGVRVASHNFLAASYDFKAFQARYRPQLSMDADLPNLSRRIFNQTLDDGSQEFVTQSNTFSSFGLNILQRIPQTGGTITLRSELFNIRNFEPFNRSSWGTTPFLLRISQPIFQANFFKWDREEQHLQFRVAQVQYARIKETVAQNISNIYFSALSAQLGLIRAQLNVANNDTIYNISRGRFKVGKIAENELLQSELNLRNAQADEQRASLDYQRAIQQLKTALGFDRSEEISVDIPQSFPEWEVEPEFAVSKALEFGEDIINSELANFQAERDVTFTRKDNGLNADLTASIGLNNTANDFGDLLNDVQDRQFVSLGLEIPIFRWGQGKAEFNAALARQQSVREQQNLIRQQLADDVYYRIQNLNQLRSQVDISSRSDTIAQRRYDIAKNRYLVGKISIQDLFLAQSDKDAAQVQYVRTLGDYWSAVQELRSVTLFDFETMQPIRPTLPLE